MKKKDWGKEKKLSKKTPQKNKNKRVDDGLLKERRAHQVSAWVGPEGGEKKPSGDPEEVLCFGRIISLIDEHGFYYFEWPEYSDIKFC